MRRNRLTADMIKIKQKANNINLRARRRIIDTMIRINRFILADAENCVSLNYRINVK